MIVTARKCGIESGELYESIRSGGQACFPIRHFVSAQSARAMDLDLGAFVKRNSHVFKSRLARHHYILSNHASRSIVCRSRIHSDGAQAGMVSRSEPAQHYR